MIDWKKAAKQYRHWLKETNKVNDSVYRQACNFEEALDIAQHEFKEAQESIDSIQEANDRLWVELGQAHERLKYYE